MESLMNRKFVSIGILMVLAGGLAAARWNEQPTTAAPVVANDDAMEQQIDQKAAKIVESVKLTDAAKAAKVMTIVSEWLTVMTSWHKEHDAELNRLWGEW